MINLRSFVAGAIVAILILVLAGFFTIRSGVYDVGADQPHASWIRKTLRAGMVGSVQTNASSLQVPDEVKRGGRSFSNKAAVHYKEMCQMCHGAPGAPRANWLALSPEPPELARRSEWNADWSDGELFWIIKHGIKDTGMGAYGLHADDDEVWRLAAFVRELPELSPDEYSLLVSQFPAVHEHGREEMHEGKESGAEGEHHADAPHHEP